eukprot:jgi/Orpsp1_1/1176811/evm.model.c7180000059129.1
MFFMLSIPNYRENHETRFKITEYLITTYYIIEISIRYFLYTFYDITTYNRIDEFYSEKESFLNLSERQYRIITIKEYKNKSDKEIKKKKKNFVHLIRFFFNKMEIICVLNISPLFVQIIMNKSLNEIYNNSKLSIIISLLFYTRFIRFGYYIIHTRLSKFFKIDMLIQVFKNAKEGIISTILLSIWSIIFFSGFFFFAETYDCEYDNQTEKLYRYNDNNELEECRVHSIIDAYWWALVTIQCIGYGDLTPITYMGRIVNGCIVLIANMIFSIPSAILTIEFLDLIMEKRKRDVIEKAVIKCENKIEKARKKNFHKELYNIFSSENLIQSNANTFIKYYNIHGSLSGSGGSLDESNISLNKNNPTNIIDFFKLKKSNNSLGRPLDKYNNSIHGSIESITPIKSSSYYDYQKYSKSNLRNEYIKPIKSNSLNNNNNNNDNNNNNNNKILKSSEILLSDPTTTIKYDLGNKLINITKKSKNPDILKLNKIIRNQKYLNKLTTSNIKSSNPFGMEGNGSGDSYNSMKNRKNNKGEIEVEFKLGEVKYMTVSEISKELYKLSMEYYAQCDDEFSEVDEQSGTLYLLMKSFEKCINQIRKIKSYSI